MPDKEYHKTELNNSSPAGSTPIAEKSSLIFFNRIICAMLGYVGLFFIAQYMGPVALGIIGFGFGFLGIFCFISELGFGAAHMKRVSEGKDLGRCVGTFLSARVILTGIMVVAVVGTIFIWKLILHKGFENPIQEIVVYVLLIYFIFINLAGVALTTFAARKETAKQQLPMLIGIIIQTILIVFVAVTYLGVAVLAGAYALGAIGVFIVASFLFRGYPISKPDKKYFKSYFKFAVPIMIVSSFAVISMNVDKVMIQLFWTSKDVGFYFGVQQITGAIQMVSAAVMTLFLPTISLYHANGVYEHIRRLTNLAERYISMIVVPVVALIIILAEPIIHVLLGDRFLPAAPILRILSVFALLMSVNGPYMYQIMGIDRPDISAKIGMGIAIINICLNLLLIPQYIFGIKLFGLGAVGAAIATVCSVAVATVLFRFATYRLTGTKQNWRISLHLISAGIMGVVLYHFTTIVAITRWYHLLGFALVGLGAYFGILYLLREFTKEDFHFFADTLRPAGMKEYVISELKNR